MKRHLVVDARCVSLIPTGIGNAVLRQLAGLDKLLNDTSGERWQVTAIRLGRDLTEPGYLEYWKAFRNIHFVESWADPTSHPRSDWWMHVELPRLLRDLDTDVYYGPAYMVPFRISRRIARMVMFHDDLAWSHPTSYPFRFRHFIRMQMHLSSKAAERIIFPSHAARDSCTKRLGLAKNRVGVVHHGLPERQAPILPQDQRDDLVVCVASAEARKNQMVLVKALAGYTSPRLALVGYSPGDRGHLEKLRSLRAPLEIVPVASHVQVESWLSRAALFALPTLGEGFGFPVIEAMAAGTPLLLSDLPVMREVAGDAAVYLPPGDPKAWRKAIESLLANPTRREHLSALGLERVATFSLENCAKGLLREASRAIKSAHAHEKRVHAYE